MIGQVIVIFISLMIVILFFTGLIPIFSSTFNPVNISGFSSLDPMSQFFFGFFPIIFLLWLIYMVVWK